MNGNNVKLTEDLVRRVRYVRLVSEVERPEERTGFRHPDLLRHVADNRFELVHKALLILAAFDAAGRPRQSLAPWGGYEASSPLTRSNFGHGSTFLA